MRTATSFCRCDCVQNVFFVRTASRKKIILGHRYVSDTCNINEQSRNALKGGNTNY